MGKAKGKRQYPENFRSLAGFFMTMFANAFAATVLGIFMIFLTDYSGIDTAMGKLGYAAGFGTLFLLVTRIIDAVDDPVQGWIVDSAKERKFGKYRMFGIIGTLVLAVGLIMLFAMPQGVKGNAILLWVWAVLGYLLFDMGSALSAITAPLVQKSTTVPRIRAKILSVIRMAAVIAAIPSLFFVTIVTALGKGGNLGKTASITAVIFCLIACAVTILGILLLKEPYLEKANEEKKGAVGASDILNLVKKDKPLWIHSLGFLIGNMSYGLAAGVMLYFIKWYFCADMATGEVDLAKFAALSGIYSLVALIPNFLCPFLTTLVLKIFKTVDRSMSGCMLIMACGYGAIYVLNMTGIMRAVPALLFVLFFIVMIPSGMTAIFSTLLTVECADYAEYTIGRNMTAITNSLYGLTQKAASAIGAAVPGILLVAVGYSVNEATGAYTGDLASLPGMVSGLSLVLALVPAIMAAASFLIYKFFYKITPEVRETMTKELERRHEEQGAAGGEA